MATKKAELIFIPTPVTGHLLVTIELAKRLFNLDSRIHAVTILNWKLPFAPKSDVFATSLVATEPRIRLIDLPEIQDPPPMDLFYRASEAYLLQFVKKTAPLVRNAISGVVSSCRGSDSVRVAGLVLDFLCNPLIEVGDEFNLRSYIFLTCNAGFLSLMKYLPDRHRAFASKLDRNSGDEKLTIPGFSNPVPTSVLPSGLFENESYEAFVELAVRFAGAKGILVNSYAELEPHGLDYFRQEEKYPPVYPVGPVLSLEDRPSPNHEKDERIGVMKWLDDQPESSVVFVCFGSMGTPSAPQWKEIARTVDLVDSRFLLSIRTDPTNKNASPYDLLPDGFLDRVAGRVMVCGWAPQVEVLAHKAIRGFVSHCGWNSILESLWFNVPIATWPMDAEQQLNAFTMAEEVGLAVELRIDYVWAHGDIVTADEIARAVRRLMDGSDALRDKVKEMAEAAKKAVMDGGSSSLATASFIGEILDVDF